MPSYGYYRLRATDNGFQLSWVGPTMTINFDDEGSHGPLAALYAETERVYHEARNQVEVDRKQKSDTNA